MLKLAQRTWLFPLPHGGQHISSLHIFFSPRCFLWGFVHWHGRCCFIDGERFTGKHAFSVLQRHHLLQFSTTRCWSSSFYIQAALSIFGMISGPLLGLYLLGMLFRTTNSIVSVFHHQLKTNKQTCTFRKRFIVSVYFAGDRKSVV